MKKDIYPLPRQLSTIQYKDLLDYAINECEYVLFVLRKNVAINQNATSFLEMLLPFFIGKETKSKWPGTELLDCEASVFYFRLTTESLRLIKDNSTSFNACLLPELPEDLCLLRNDLTPWLVSITHENDFYLELTKNEYDRIVDKFPNLIS